MKSPIFYKGEINGIKLLSVYEYDNTLKERIYQLKGCFDIELARAFLITYSLELRLMYFNHFIICAPSYFLDDEKRGFNHVHEIFSVIGLPFLDVLEKTEHHKQSDQRYVDRGEIKKYIRLKENIDLTGKNVLLVDDILTTGNTLKTCANLIKSLNPKSIKILVLCKTRDLNER